ncbi:copper resistance CopC family protein [Curtobacterium sp. VKM Ac-1395]|uniref:copper resistance CopC family protein n=1 Tax=Curtobacterium sp. VKM Ac-1395 TaxID=2783815 RepID=UPI00188B2F01|nr:copper resistance CopC family protein [Curtobacterium sp. VKM Ac-1395]MBF4590038.1 copper resistance protein CopC [Curtobacterium sp. VKM Ac-1395]
MRRPPTARRLLATSAAVLAIAGGAVLGLAGPADAHNYLIASTPKVDGTLTALPKAFEITTNDKLLDIGGSGSGFAYRIVGPDEKYYEDGCVDIDGPSMTTTAALGASGKYQVEWQIVSADGHTVSDEYPFTWDAPAGFTPASGSSTPPTCARAGSSSSETTTGTASGASDSPATDALWIGAGGLVVVAAIVAVLLLLRRRPSPSPDDDPSDTPGA